MSKINVLKLINYWKSGAEQNFETAKYLFEGKRYADSLFFCHLMVEKILKALVIKETKRHAPHIHKLVDLANIANIELSDQQIEILTTITEFNIAARYNAIKFNFYKRCNQSYTEKYFQISKNLYLWLKKQLYLKK